MSPKSSSRRHSDDEKRTSHDALKALETPEQKRLRRFAKKEAKERRRKEQMGWDEEYMGYTNTDNPFGDTNLLKTFVWEKKLEKEGLKTLAKEEIEWRNKLKLEENRLELEKVKQRRLEREHEREIREEELTKIQREKEAAQFKEWEKQEDTFHLKQAKLRSKIRIQEGRAKPIDLLARYVCSLCEDEDFTIEMHEPYVYLNGLKTQDLEDLQEDIRIYMELENGKNLDYWKDLQIIVDDEIHKMQKSDSSDAQRRDGINSAVGAEIVHIFKGKTPNQLKVMYNQIQKKITSSEEGVDISYWETLLSRLKAYMAKARLRERHQDNLRLKLFQLKQEQGVEPAPLFPCISAETSSKQSNEPSIPGPSDPGPSTSDKPEFTSHDPQSSNEKIETASPEQESNSETDDAAKPKQEEKEKEVDYVSGRYSPTLIPFNKLEPDIFLIDATADAQRIEFIQGCSKNKPEMSKDALSAEEKNFEKVAKMGMNAEEATFSVEFQYDKTYLWSDKYRPRKPRYFNRVHTGFEWNKYNQTHYDMDNPPPKIVQGYKFNIFYPDLIDKTKTPEYTLVSCEDNRDFAILKFHSGPPYEDIAFKIVNREWEYSYKRGFRCQFHNNIFQLWFHFKRYRYRR